MIKKFDEAVKFLERYIPTPDKKHPGELGLARMKYLMELLGNPQMKYSTIHVGGTSGKGSTATIIAAILSTKYKVGLHTSPHLARIIERIKILSNIKNQISNIKNTYQKSNIEDEKFVELLNSIIPTINAVEKTEFGPPSYFEIVAAMAFLYFMERKVDIAVIEVGLGGKYDATNVIKPLVAVITNVGLDHTEILGNTVEKIAEDKAGIIKSGIEVISGVRQKSVIQILRSKIKNQKSKLSLLNRDFSYKVKKIDEEGSVFDYKGIKSLENLKIKLLGEHQVGNAAVAIRVIEVLNTPISTNPTNTPINVTMKQFNNETIGEKEIRLGLAFAYIPGRLEIISNKPLIILDGAHNPDKVRALTASVKKIFPGRKVTSIIAIKNDKNAKEMLSQLLEISRRVIFTKFQLTADQGIISSYDPKDLLKIARKIDKDKPMSVVNNAKKALEQAIKIANRDDLILVTGSLYLIGEIKSKII